MSEDDLLLTNADLRSLAEMLAARPSSPVDDHLLDEDYVEYVMERVTSEKRARIDAHLVSCEECLSAMEHLVEVSEAWEGSAGDARLEALSAQLLASRAASSTETTERLEALSPLRVPDGSALWAAVKAATASARDLSLRFESDLVSGLMLQPSAVHFGGDALSDGAPRIHCRFGVPRAVLLGSLYSANGRSLPEDAELFWGYEIWLIQLPMLMTLGRNDVQSVGFSLAVSGGTVEIVDTLPKITPTATSHDAGALDFVDEEYDLSWCSVDVQWNGTMSLPDGKLALDAARVLPPAGEISLATNDTRTVGRLSVLTSPLGVHSVAVGPGHALFIFSADGAPTSFAGSLWISVVADKHLSELSLSAQSWVQVLGVNGVPVRLTTENVTQSVTLTPSPDN